MDGTAPASGGASAVERVVAAAGPVSVDRVLELTRARPSELWRWLGEASAAGWICEVDGDAIGWFAFCDHARRGEVLSGMSDDDWRALTRLDGMVPAMVESARADLRARRAGPATAILRALLRVADRAAFPGGTRGWSEIVGQCVRASSFGTWVDAATLDEALGAAVESGDLRLQAVLAAARGFTGTRADPPHEANAWFERALDAAAASGDRAVAFEVHVRIAYGQVVQGRPHEAIATFERFLGDVPEEYVPLPAELAPSFSAVPEAPLAVLGSCYGQIGQYGRGIDMLHRMCSAGQRLGRPELVALGQTFLSGLYGGRRDMDGVRAHAEPAFEFWRSSGAEPWLVWHTSHQLALARVAEGRLSDARAVLEIGNRARLTSRIPFFAGSALFEVLDRLDAERLAPAEGLDLDAEIERMLQWPGAYMRGIALRYQARRLARGAPDDASSSRVTGALAESVAQLRASRASPVELARSLEESAQWAARGGQGGLADRLSAEARNLFVSLDLASGAAGYGSAHAAAAVVELGRLGALAGRREGVWGEIAARLCAALGGERCALVDATEPVPRALAARGGGPQWLAAIVALATARRFDRPEVVEPARNPEEPPAPGGHLLVVPFASDALRRRGWAFLENRHSRPAVQWSDEVLLKIVQGQLGVVLENVCLWQELSAARQRLEQENRYYREAGPSSPRRTRLVASSAALQRVLALVERVAPATTTVLIEGETGVGKEIIARELHRLSPRADAPFIAVHIASLAPGLVASGLFGHERGAFTGATEQARGRFELADGGTLFLDEIGELALEDQVRLLRVLQEGTFERVGGTKPVRSDFRLLAATNRDLAAEVKAGRFREDLYFRLTAFPIRVPPLRERREEIPTLALHFMELYGRKRGLRFEGISEADVERLVEYAWPGNVRELEHVVERALLLSDPPQLRIPPLGEGPRATQAAPVAELGGWVTLSEAERRYLRRLIDHTGGRITGPGGAAELSGLKPSTLTWRIGKLGLRSALAQARASRVTSGG